MRLELLEGVRTDPAGGELKRDVGAAVVRAHPAGGMVLELGPSDGPPQVRLTLGSEEAARLAGAIQAVANGRGEAIVIVDD